MAVPPLRLAARADVGAATPTRPVLSPLLMVAGLGGLAMLPAYRAPASWALALAGAVHMLTLLAAGGLMVRAALRGDAVMRKPRLLFAASLSASGLGSLITVGYVVLLGRVPLPSLVDVVTPLWVPFAAWGFWLVPTRTGSVRATLRLVADGLVAVTALLLSSWILVLEPLHARGSGFVTGAVQALYPLVDVFMVAVVCSLLPRARADLRPFLNAVAVGLMLVCLADSGSVAMLVQQGEIGFGWPNVAMEAGLCSLLFAAAVRRPPVMAQRPVASPLDWALPLTPVLLAVGVGMWKVVTAGQVELDECVLASAMIVAIMARQLLYTVDLARVAEAHRDAAARDALTGLPNRQTFLTKLTEHVETPGSGAAAVLLLDLNGFKAVNDTLGHVAGDEVLRRFTDRLRACTGGALLARLGGDEFAVLLPLQRPEAAHRLAADLARCRVSTAHGGEVSCAVGLAMLLPDDTAAEALHRADLAMYAAKSSPSGTAVYDQRLAAAADRRAAILAQLPGAAARGELSLVYQPIFRLDDGSLTGAEALLRWTHPALGHVPPDEFIPLAEHSGDITDIGAWVLDTALAQVRAWREQGRRLPKLFLNMAASQFTPTLADEVHAQLTRYGVAASCLTLEVTETQIPGTALNQSITRLRAQGVHVALDDFGVGYSSLAQIARLPVDVLKIDREFIRNLDDGSGRAVLDAVVTLARALGLATVAEGIEDLSQAAEVANAGVDYAQGYLFRRPVPAVELTGSLPLIGCGDQPVSAPVTQHAPH